MNTFTPPPQTDFDVDIDESQQRFFADNGYLVIGRVTTDEELQWLRDSYEQLLALPRSGFPDTLYDTARPYGTRDTPLLGQLLYPELRVPAIRQTAMWRNALRIAQRLLKIPIAEIESWGHLVHKPARHGATTPWHQDEAYWAPEYTFHAVGSWLPLDDVNIENGCLWFIPESHRQPVVPHHHSEGDPAIALLEPVDAIDATSAVPVPLAAGAMTFHHPRTLHYAGANVTDRPRRAWANEFQSARVLLDTPADRPWVIEGRSAMASRYAKITRPGAD